MFGVPGSNVLSSAFELLETQTIQYLKFQSRSLNRIGIWDSTFASPVDVEASVQEVDNDVYKQLGLDFQKTYKRLYIELDVIDLERGATGDQFIISGDTYQLTSSVQWFEADGWVSLIAIKITT